MSNSTKAKLLAYLAIALAVASLIMSHTTCAHADPIQCDPLTPLFDYKYCYVLHQLQGSPSVDKDGHPYYGWGHN
jgi:hypothetical protein